IIAGDGNEAGVGQADDFRIGENERTARDAVVSGTAERMTIHLPHQDRLTLLRGLSPRFPEIDLPQDLFPLLLYRLWLDQPVQFFELIWGHRLGGGRKGRQDHGGKETPAGGDSHVHETSSASTCGRWCIVLGHSGQRNGSPRDFRWRAVRCCTACATICAC